MGAQRLRVAFLDRDGVINHDSPDYIKHWSEVRFIPGSLSAVKALNDAGFAVMVITNQSAVHRRLITMAELARIHRKMQAAARREGGCITAFFFCPHLPDEGCTCRKPLPGLIRRAQEVYPIEIEGSVMVGDSAKDIACGKAAGCGATILVRTGNGATAETVLAREGIRPDKVSENLADAAVWIASRKAALRPKKGPKKD